MNLPTVRALRLERLPSRYSGDYPGRVPGDLWLEASDQEAAAAAYWQIVPADEPGLMRLVRDAGNGGGFHLEPVNDPQGDEHGPRMFGGDHAVCGDSRRAHEPDWPGRYAVPIHDRRESWDQYAALSTD